MTYSLLPPLATVIRESQKSRRSEPPQQPLPPLEATSLYAAVDMDKKRAERRYAGQPRDRRPQQPQQHATKPAPAAPDSWVWSASSTVHRNITAAVLVLVLTVPVILHLYPYSFTSPDCIPFVRLYVHTWLLLSICSFSTHACRTLSNFEHTQ